MNENLFEVLRAFRLDAKPVSCEPYGCGHINVTYLAVTESGLRYILQKINNNTFRDVAGLMENITAVTEFLRTKTDDPRGVLTLVETHDGASYLHAQDAYWRVYDFVEDSICLQLPETDEDFYQSAVGFGTFQQLLTDFPAAKLHETIPNFHNTPDRYRALLETLERDPMHRAAQVQPEIEFALARQAEMSAIQNANCRCALRTMIPSSITSFWTQKHAKRCASSISTRSCLDRVFMTSAIPSALARQLPQRMKKISPKWR